MRRRAPLAVVLALALLVTGFVSTWRHPRNAAPPTTGIATLSHASTTALFCTGLSGPKGPTPGVIVLTNTANASRQVTLSVSSDTRRSATTTLELAAHAHTTFAPASLVAGNFYGVTLEINGAGVIAVQVGARASAETPCESRGVTSWYATGFNTVVGSSARLSVLNTTATPSVFNVATYSTAGFSTPSTMQGLSVPAHGEVIVNLGEALVNTLNVGVGVKVLRGSLVFEGVQASSSTSSFVQGNESPSSNAVMPAVSTTHGVTAQVRLANPTSQRVKVTVKVVLAQYKIAPQVTHLAPYSTGEITITPNPAIASAGYATLFLTASQPVVTSLETGTTSSIGLSSPEPPATSLVLSDATAKGLDAVVATSTAPHPLKVTLQPLGGGPSVTATIDPHQSLALAKVVSPAPGWRGALYELSAPSANVVLGLTLPTRPRGTVVIEPLDGR